MDNQNNQGQQGPNMTSVVPDDETLESNAPDDEGAVSQQPPAPDDQERDQQGDDDNYSGRQLNKKDFNKLGGGDQPKTNTPQETTRHSHSGRPRNRLEAGGGRTGKGIAKATKTANTAGRAGMAAARTGAIAAAPETLGVSAAELGYLEAGKQAVMFAKQGPINYFKNKEQTIKKLPQTGQKWLFGCVGIFTLLFIFMGSFVAIIGGFFSFLPQMAAQAKPAPSEQSPSVFFTIKKTGPATAKTINTEILIYNIQLTDTRGGADITVTDQIPPGTVYKSSSGNGQYNSSTRTVTWTLKGSQSVNLVLQPTSANFNSYIFNSVSASSTFSGYTEKASSCWQTTVGKPASKPNPPQGCQTTPTTGIVFPPNLDPKLCKPVRAENSNGIPGEYCQMPPSLDGAYVNTPRKAWYDRINGRVRGPQIWGSKELIGVLYTVAERWKEKYPKGKLLIGDMTSSYHKSHFWGSTVDIRATTDGTDCVANFAGSCRAKYNELATVELGWLIVDTGYMHTILHNAILIPVTYKDPNTGATRTSSVNKAIFDYAKNKYPTRFSRYHPFLGVGVQYEGGHDNHFHLYTDRDQAYNNYKYNTSWCGAINKAKLLDCRLVPGTNCPRTYEIKPC